jgi:hypothetical protein
MSEMCPLYTQEEIVFRPHLAEVDMEEPVFTAEDSAGHEVVMDGNHRAYYAEINGLPLRRRVVARIKKDVSQDPNFRLVSQLKAVEPKTNHFK